MEICVGILLLMIFGPIAARLLGAILRALGPLIAAVIGIALVLGVVALAFNIIGGVVNTALDLLLGPLGILLLMGAGGYVIYRQWKKQQPPATFAGGGAADRITLPDEKIKRRPPQPVIGDDGEIVTLDELLDEEVTGKRKRG